MMRRVLLLLLLSLAGSQAQAQIVRLNARSTRAAGLPGVGSITISATPSSVSFALVPGGEANASSSITITTGISLSTASTVSLYGYFAGTSALTNSVGDILPSSAVYGQCTTGTPTSFTAFTQSGPFASGSSLLIFQQSNVLLLGTPRTDALSLMINLAGISDLPAGSYSGTLILQAQAL